MNLLSAKAAIEKKVVICNEEQWRPFVHVNDIARAFCLMLDAPVAKVSGEVFNVGSEGMNHHLGDVGRAIARLVSEVTVVRESNEDVRNYRVSFAKIHERLGSSAKRTLTRESSRSKSSSLPRTSKTMAVRSITITRRSSGPGMSCGPRPYHKN